MSCATCNTGNGIPKGCKSNGSCQVNGCDKLTVFDWLADLEMPSFQEPYNIVEVQFKNDRKAYFKNTKNLPLQIGDLVVVDANPGIDVGKVSLRGELVKTQEKIKKVRKENIFPILRKATQSDIDNWQKNRAKEEQTMIKARKIAKDLALSMKISDVEYQADGGKLTFYYTAEGRVDFRQLIKEYAEAFRSKIDMRQIGYRQETAKIGGIGSCGRELCCSSWLTDFRSVNTAAARYQQLSINPQKLAGQCGKLKCCLNFELDSYLDALDSFPPQNTTLITEKGKAYCVKIDVFRKKMSFMYEDNSFNWYEFSTQEVEKFVGDNKKGIKLLPLEDLIADDVTQKSLDIIGENSLDRFERNRHKKHAHAKPKSTHNNGQKFDNQKKETNTPKIANRIEKDPKSPEKKHTVLKKGNNKNFSKPHSKPQNRKK